MSNRREDAGARFEELLDGRTTDGSAIARVLSAARAPGAREEMAGLAAARAAFMEPRRTGRFRVALPTATRAAAGRLLVLKAMAAVSGATLIGGVAYAASGSHLLFGSGPHHNHPVISASGSGAHRTSRVALGPAAGGAGSYSSATPHATIGGRGAPTPVEPSAPRPSATPHRTRAGAPPAGSSTHAHPTSRGSGVSSKARHHAKPAKSADPESSRPAQPTAASTREPTPRPTGHSESTALALSTH